LTILKFPDVNKFKDTAFLFPVFNMTKTMTTGFEQGFIGRLVNVIFFNIGMVAFQCNDRKDHQDSGYFGHRYEVLDVINVKMLRLNLAPE